MGEDLANLFFSALQIGADLLNSNFFTALVGAFAGAYGAQVIAERGAQKNRVLEEIRNTNAAIMISFSVTNTFCTLKDQHVGTMKSKYEKQKEELAAFQKGRKDGSIAREQVFDIQCDFQAIPETIVPIELLKSLLFEKLSLVGRPLSVVAVLSQTIHSLEKSIEERNKVIAFCKDKSPVSNDELVPLYFGLPNKAGHVDTSYSDSMRAIANLTDDCIFFSKFLGEDLRDHGLELAKSYGRKAPDIQKIDFSNAEQSGLIPRPEEYRDWIGLPKASMRSE